MKEVPLTRGKVAFVDDADFELVSSKKWHTQITRNSSLLYVTACMKGTKRKLWMHRYILGVNDPSVVVDHIDGNPLNNVRSNLRICTKAQNQKNIKPHRDNSTGFLGVGYRKSRGKYRARIWDGKKEVLLGHFDNGRDAAIAYNKAAIKIHGQFARLNKV